MPPIELLSLKAFCAWLEDTFVSPVPFGLSLRLRPLLTSPEVPSSSGVVLVRPHAGHILLSLLAQDASESAEKPLGRAASARGGSSSGSSTDVPASCEPPSWPSILQTLLQVARSDDPHLCDPFSASVFNVAAVDGVGRKMHLYTALLRHCAVWWAVKNNKERHGGHTPPSLLCRSAEPFLFFESSAVAPPLTGHAAVQHQHDAQRGLLRVLQRLRQRGGWRLSRIKLTSAASEAKQDWLDYIVQEAVQCDLEPSGDYVCLSDVFSRASPTSPSTSGQPWATPPCTSASSQPAVSTEAMCAVVWHTLATEVDGEVHAVLYRLLQEYIFCARVPSLSMVRCALDRLVRHPTQAFTCSPASPAIDGGVASRTGVLLPPVCAPVALSRALPSDIAVLPFAADAASSASMLPHRFFLRAVRCVQDGAGGFVVPRTALLRVLLLRVDPEGNWLPTAEAMASQRTFSASFQRQGERNTSATPCGHGDGNDNDDFAVWEARSAGRRAVSNRPCRSSEVDAAGALDTENSPAEDMAVSVLTTHVLGQAPFAQSIASAREGDRCVWRATVRLYLYALLHGVRVILSPERLPDFTKTFGYRHIHQLHRSLCSVKSSGGAAKAAQTAPNMRIDAATSALLAAACAQEPPVAIYLADQLDLLAFTRLLERAGSYSSGDGLSSSSSPPLPLVLCRDTLRHAASPGATSCLSKTPQQSLSTAKAAQFPHGVVSAVTHCCILDEEVLCRTWARCSSYRDADALLEACAGTEQHFVPHRRNVCILAFRSLEATSCLSSHEEKCASTVKLVDGTQAKLRLPSIFLVAPTHQHVLSYTGVLRKAGLALLDALPDPRYEDAVRSSHVSPARVDAMVHGVVRGGGGFYVALARQLHLLRRRLHATATSAPAAPVPCTSSAAVAPDHDEGDWGGDLTWRDRRWACYVLYLLAEACGAVATHHAESVIDQGRRGCAATDVTSRTWTCGPRARRRLWLAVLRDAVETQSPALWPRPVLHVRHADTTSEPAHLRSFCVEGGSFDGQQPKGDDEGFLYELGMRVFAQPHFVQEGNDAVGAGAGSFGESGHHAEPPLLEPLSTNVRAVREALSLLLLTLSAAL